jgi:polyhydroxybutyrate depolymerase
MLNNLPLVFWWRVSWIVFLLFSIAHPSHADSNKVLTKAIALDSGGINRKAILYVPPDIKRSEKPVLVVVLHGGGGDAAGTLEKNGWLVKAEQQGFIVIAPEGLGIRPKLPSNFKLNPAVWNSGQYQATSPNASINDVAFIRDLLEHTKSIVDYDEARVFVTGHSNGGGMTFRLAAELSEKFAAIAMVAGRMTLDAPKPQKALPTLYIVGTLDPLMPLAGGEVKSPWGGSWTNRPVDEQLSIWATAMRCAANPKTVQETITTKAVVYADCASNPSKAGVSSGKPAASVTVLYLKGHGHHWPGGKQALPNQLMGPIVENINATDTIWEFFNKY